MSNKTRILGLYKQLIRESSKFSSYNFREYAKRRVKHEFEENKNVTDSKRLQELVRKGEQNLDLIKRQAIISRLYAVEKTVIE